MSPLTQDNRLGHQKLTLNVFKKSPYSFQPCQNMSVSCVYAKIGARDTKYSPPPLPGANRHAEHNFTSRHAPEAPIIILVHSTPFFVTRRFLTKITDLEVNIVSQRLWRGEFKSKVRDDKATLPGLNLNQTDSSGEEDVLVSYVKSRARPLSPP